MKLIRPKCSTSSKNIVRFGSFFRKSDSKKIHRFYCKKCGKHFSQATFSENYQQNKRRLNNTIYELLCSCVSQRRIAIILGISRTTVQRKLKFLATQARKRQQLWRSSENPILRVQFDDLETFEHTKCKPLTVTMVIDSDRRKILDFEVAQIPAKGHLAKISRKKYGLRPDHSRNKRRELFSRLSPFIHERAEFSTDQHIDYPLLIQRFFPKAEHFSFKRSPSCVTGQGELKKISFDPLFSVNHTFAMLRANINRLVRRTWCTTKDPEALRDHISLYVDFHNRRLTA